MTAKITNEKSNKIIIKALIIGGGVSGRAAARLAKSRGWAVRISDRAVMDVEKKSELLALGIEVCDGGHAQSHLDQATLVIVSPGVRGDHPLSIAARAQKIPILSEIDFALQDFRGCLIAVTGTNGKSTTVSMVGHLLKNLGVETLVGGNLGVPPCDMVLRGDLKSSSYSPSHSPVQALVLELSSYQLEQCSPHLADAAAFTSFSNDHVERHGTLAAYMAAKWRVFDWVRPGGLCVLTAEVASAANVYGMIRRQDVQWVEVAGFSAESSAPDFVRASRVTGRHNEINAEISIRLVAHLLQRRDFDVIAPMLRDFKSLVFRCEQVGTIAGQPVFNDSKSTNCESTCAALAGLKSAVILMMGGRGKGESYLSVSKWRATIHTLLCFGESGQSIADQLELELSPAAVETFTTMTAAVAHAAGLARQGGCGILFSPGCASFDEFRNFEHRGHEFNNAIGGALDGPKK